VLILSLIGNLVKVGGEPVAVVGDEHCRLIMMIGQNAIARRSGI